ncbi:Alpha-trehalose glucohydrolase [Dirofilaria immitis]|nr:Alpha-trehalose glucohydrolase [Dirofilaria immitis]
MDWVEEPENIRRLKDAELKRFARKLNELWKVLAREFVEQVHKTPELFPILPVSNAFIVPGGSFQIYFYWDSYWINKGLLFSNMSTTVRQILENLASVVRFHGFIPNSGSVQLSRRSHPPLFTQMVADYYDATGNKTLLKEMTPWLDQEILWWGKTEHLTSNCHPAISSCPRPENYLIDLNNGLNGTGHPEFIWSSIASACESGLDFSTRWFAHQGKYADTKYSIRTNDIIPVDLNVFMAWNFATLANFHEILGRTKKAAEYRQLYKKLRKAVDEVFGMKMMGHGGIPVSLNKASHEQWDYPNSWPPLTHLFVESLRLSRNEKLIKIAEKIAWKFIRTAYNGMMNPTKGMPAACWEKYDVRYDDGRPGSGGEYPVQQGFGWTNGALLDLIYKYGIPGQYMISRSNLKVNKLGRIMCKWETAHFFGYYAVFINNVLVINSFALHLKKFPSVKDEKLQLAEAVRLLDNEW